MDELRIGPGPSMALLDFVEKIVSGELFSACSGILSSQVEGMVREKTIDLE
jgi:hypothetical protein